MSTISVFIFECHKIMILMLFQSRPDRYVPLFGDNYYDPSKWRTSVPFVEQLRAFQDLVDEGKVVQVCNSLTIRYIELNFLSVTLQILNKTSSSFTGYLKNRILKFQLNSGTGTLHRCLKWNFIWSDGVCSHCKTWRTTKDCEHPERLQLASSIPVWR